MGDDKTTGDRVAAMVRGAAQGAAAGGFLGGPAGVLPGAALGATKEGVGHVVDVFRKHLRSPADRSLEDAVAAEAEQDLAAMHEDLVEQVDALRVLRGGFDDIFRTLSALLDLWLRAQQRTMHPGKRKMLNDALLNALDPDMYKRGLTAQLFGVADACSYGELVALRHVVDEDWISLAGVLPWDGPEDLTGFSPGSALTNAMFQLAGVSPGTDTAQQGEVRANAERIQAALRDYRPWLTHQHRRALLAAGGDQYEWGASEFWDTDEWGEQKQGRILKHSLAHRELTRLAQSELVWLHPRISQVTSSGYAVNPVECVGALGATAMGKRLACLLRERRQR